METSEPYPTHADLRSPSHASTRSAKQSQKYYNFRSGPMSRIGQPVLSIPETPRSYPFEFVRAPLLTHPDAVRVRTWTKRDQFDERTWDIWPLDRKDHKVGRRRRGRGCNYVPARWEMERSMKGRKHLIEGDELETEEDGAEDAAVALGEGRVLIEYDVAGDDYLNVDGGEASPIEFPRGSSDMPFDLLSDLLSDLSSEADDIDWEFVDAN